MPQSTKHGRYVGVQMLSKGQKHGWDAIQVTTIGTRWPMSRAFNKEELDTLLLAGTCMGCHQNMSDKKLWERVSEKGKLDTKQHLEMINKMIKYMAEKARKGKDW